MKEVTSKVTVSSVINDEKLMARLWDIYIQSFEGQEVRNPQNQCFFHDYAAFSQVISDPDWQKHVVYGNDQAVGLALVTKNLEKARLGYINPECYEANAPDFIGNIYYVAVMFILKEFQGTKCFWDFNESIFEHTVKNGGAVGLDVNETLMPDFCRAPITYLKAIGINAGAKKLGSQAYFLITPEKK